MKTIFTTTDISDKLTQVIDSHASLNAKIVAQMHAGIAHFYFTKKSDGSVREAYGTLNKDILEQFLGPMPETTPSEPVPNSDQVFQKFYDVAAPGEPKRKWKQYEIASLIALF